MDTITSLPAIAVNYPEMVKSLDEELSFFFFFRILRRTILPQ
jgi:hypothetical protein